MTVHLPTQGSRQDSIQALLSTDPILSYQWRTHRREPALEEREPSWVLGQVVAHVMAPRWLWALETDVGHRRVFSANRWRHWDRPYARMLLDTRPYHWPVFHQRTAEDLRSLVEPWWSSTPIEQNAFFEGLEEGMASVTATQLRTTDPQVVQALQQALAHTLGCFKASLDSTPASQH